MPLLLLLCVSAGAAVLTYWAWTWRVWRRSAEGPIEKVLDDALEDAGPVARTTALVPAMGALTVVFVMIGALALLVERNTPVRRWDDQVERWASEQAGPLGTDVLRLITHLGDTVTVLTLAAVATALLLAWVKRPRWALFLVVVVVGQWALANAIKWLVGRPRPALDPLATFSGNSFPSGHTTAAAATYLALALVVSALVVRADRRQLVAVAVGLGVAVGGSRALLGVHWFTDVVAGLLLGWAWCLVSLAVLDPDRRRSPRPGRHTASTP